MVQWIFRKKLNFIIKRKPRASALGFAASVYRRLVPCTTSIPSSVSILGLLHDSNKMHEDSFTCPSLNCQEKRFDGPDDVSVSPHRSSDVFLCNFDFEEYRLRTVRTSNHDLVFVVDDVHDDLTQKVLNFHFTRHDNLQVRELVDL